MVEGEGLRDGGLKVEGRGLREGRGTMLAVSPGGTAELSPGRETGDDDLIGSTSPGGATEITVFEMIGFLPPLRG